MLFYTNGLSGISGFKESATGLGENDLSTEVNVYPNPATDDLNVATTGFRSLEGMGTLHSAEGKQAKTFPITSPTAQLDVSDLPPGIYILKIETTESVVLKRVMIQ